MAINDSPSDTEVLTSDDNPSDFEAVTLALADDASGFALSETDLTTSKGSNEILQLIAGGAGGHVSGIATSGVNAQSEEAREEAEREERVTAYLAAEASINFDRLLDNLERSSREFAERMQAARRIAQELQDKLDDDLENGRINEETHRMMQATITAELAQMTQDEEQRAKYELDSQTRIASVVGNLFEVIEEINADNPARAEQINADIASFINLDSELVTIQISDPQSDLPMKVAVYEGLGTNEYFYRDPRSNETVNITDQRQIDLIQAQGNTDAANLRFANDPGAGNLAAEFNNIQIRIIDNLGAQYGSFYRHCFNELTEIKTDGVHMAVIDKQMIQRREDLTRLAENYNRRLAEGATREQLQAEMTAIISDINQMRERYGDYRQSLDQHFESFDTGVNDLIKTLNQHHSQLNGSIEQLRVNGINNRDEQIRARFPNEWSAPTQWGLPGVLQGIAEWTVTDWTAKWAASNELETAWKEDVVRHNGAAVYRDNNSLELYTYDPESGVRTAITDPNTVLALLNEAYPTNPDGTPATDFKFFMNETPYGEDPNNTFKESFLANMATDRVIEHSNEVKTDGEEQYGPQTEPAATTTETRGDLISSLSFGFGRSADYLRSSLQATVNFARSGFDTGLEMTASFSDSAGQDTEIRIAGLTDDTAVPSAGDDAEIATETTPKTLV